LVLGCLIAVITCQNLSCQQPKEKFQANAKPLIINYTKGQYEIERLWLKLNDQQKNIELSAFIFIPVKAEKNELQNVLPTKEWQTQHFDVVSRKVGGNLASQAVQSKFLLAKDGKTINQKMPLLIFGAGLGWLPTDYTNILASLASKGNVVVVISGVPISKIVQFPDGSFKTVDKTEADYKQMGKYLSFAVDEILKQTAVKKNKIFSLIDTNKVVVGGHSVSGAAALMAGAMNNRIKAIVNLDGDVNSDFTESKPVQPILYITTQPQEADDLNVNTWNEDRSEKRRDKDFVNNSSASKNTFRLKIPEMYHSDFLDVAILKDSIDKKSNNKNFGKISYQKSSTIVINSISLFIESNFTNTNQWDKLAKEYAIYIKQ
jgi:hypothetical protein